MKHGVQISHGSNSGPVLDREEFSEGRSRVFSTQLSLDKFLAGEDERMKALIELYQGLCLDGQAPNSNKIPPEKIAQTGMMNRTHCLRVDPSTKTFRFAVWAQDANFDGHRSLQNMVIVDESPFPILTKVVQAQLSIGLEDGQATFFDVRGVIDDRYYYFTKAILPLGDEQNQIVKCLVPFTNKISDVPLDLREEFCSGTVE